MLNGFRKASGTIGGYWSTIEGDTQVVSHRLDPLMILTLEPRQNGIAGKVINPAFERSGHFDSELSCLMKHGGSWIWRKDVRPELCAGKLPADIHHETHGFLPFL